MNLVEEAIETLKANGRGDFTVPSADLYPYQWLWDAGFIALGWGQVSEGRAWQELFSAFKGQWPDGFLPHIVFHRPDPNYFPGPDVWQTHTVPPTSGITQPPVLATATLILYRQARDRELARNAAEELFPKLMAYHRWLYRARDPEGTGLVSILHPWESGMDNSAAWDEPLGRVLPAELPARRKDTSHVHSSERPSDDEYRRYLSLVVRFRDLRYDPSRLYFESPFRVVDVGFNALLHQANQDLRALAIELGKPTEELDGWIRQGTQAFGRLWDDGEGLYFSLDAIAGSPIRVPTSAAFLPLYAGTPDTTAAQHLAFHLEAWGRAVNFLVPSLAPNHPRFDPRRYWRGPVWLNVNWMIEQGLTRYGHLELARRVREDTLRLLAASGFREYYHPQTGEGLGGRGFAWSAAVALLWFS